MERYRRAAVWTLIVYFVWSTMILLTEIPLIPADERTLFVVTKCLCLLSSLPLAYWLHRDVTSKAANTLVGVLFMLHTIQGQFFRPMYYLSFLQLTIAYSFLFSVSKARFRLVVGLGGLAYIVVLHTRWDMFTAQLQNPAFSDYATAVVSVALIAVLANTFFSSERLFREEALRRFGQIGLQSARVIHDLKGLIGAPTMYVQKLESRLTGSGRNDDEALAVLRLLSRDLENFRHVIAELNQLCAAAGHDDEKALLSEVIVSVQVLLKSRLEGTHVSVSLPYDIRAERNLLSSIVMNLIVNSLDAFKARSDRRPPGNPTIWIESVSERRVRVRDNAGGFDQHVLDALSHGGSLSTRPNGSGLGLLFVQESMKQIHGRVQFANGSEGACVELHFA